MGKMNRENFTEEFNRELDSLKGSGVITYSLGDVKDLTATLKGDKVTLSWKDPENLTMLAEDGTPIVLSEWAGTKIVRKLGSVPTNVNDGELIIDSKNKNAHITTGYIDDTIAVDGTYFYRAFPYTTRGIVTNGSSVSVTVQYISTGPGSNDIIGGDTSAGFFGEVPNTQFITPANLSMAIGLSAGTLQNESTPWLKFILGGKILFTTKTAIRSNLSWNDLHRIGAVFGTKVININGHTYKVRLFKSCTTNPSGTQEAGFNAKGSEWNRLMLPIHIQAKDQSWANKQYVEANVPDWGIGYTDIELQTYNAYGNGAASLCQETIGHATYNRMSRGFGGISYVYIPPADSAHQFYGWRPVLELVPPELVDKTGSPGPVIMKGGDKSAGFYGEVHSSELITTAQLNTELQMTAAGTDINSNTPWLKFALDGKVLFVAKKPIKQEIGWNTLDARNVIKGNKTIKIGDHYYRVRLLKGAQNNPAHVSDSDKDAIGSEWNRLMLPIHANAKTKNWTNKNVAGEVPDWGIGYLDSAILDNNAIYNLCQETVTGSNNVVVRGAANVIENSGQSVWNSDIAGNAWRPVLELVSPEELDETGSPGSKALSAGDKTAGFFGEVPNTELITPTDLATAVGLTEGTLINENTPWLKFILDDKILFIPKKAIRHTVKWSTLNSLGIALGSKILKIGENFFKVRFPKGALVDPANDGLGHMDAKGSEWNRLMLPIHINAKDKAWSQPTFVESNVPDWDIGYTDADLGTVQNGNGIYTLCKEKILGKPTNNVCRGGSSVAGSGIGGIDVQSNVNIGWRPVLELVGPVDLVDTTGSAGPLVLKAGNKTAGFFGEVPNAQLITPTNLASTIGLSVGIRFNEDTPWLKFSLDNKILFIPKKPIRYNLLWNNINALGAMDGTKTITVNGQTYKVRLIKGASINPSNFTVSDKSAKGSEWNRLILPLHIESRDKSWTYPAFVEDNVSDWNTHYTNEDLGVISGNFAGVYTLCQERINGVNEIVVRGGKVSYTTGETPDSALTPGNLLQMGWRPVLELVQ